MFTISLLGKGIVSFFFTIEKSHLYVIDQGLKTKCLQCIENAPPLQRIGGPTNGGGQDAVDVALTRTFHACLK